MTSLQQRLERPIFLVGFMGCGKSAIGAALAERLGLPFTDLDNQIESVAGRSIHELIKIGGEANFRSIESEVLKNVLSSPAVIATGGGVILSSANRQLMDAHGTTIWLDTPFDVCWERIAGSQSTRPLAPDRVTAWRRYQDRLSFYREAQLSIETNPQLDIEQVVAMVIAMLEARHARNE